MTSQITWTFIDHSGEQSRVTVHVDDVDSDGLNWPDLFVGITSAYELLETPLYALTKLNHVRTTVSMQIDGSPGTLPAAATAQRETAIRFTYIDVNTNKKYRLDIPAPADLAVPTGTDVINLANALVATWVTVFELHCFSEAGGNVEVIGARLVGRRN